MVIDREPLLNPATASLPPTLRQPRIFDEAQQPCRHPHHIRFSNKPTALSVPHHLRNPRMAGSYHRQTAELSLHHRHRVALTISIGRHNGVLHKPPRFPHQFSNLLLGLGTPKSDDGLEA
jgi:hypothetical protein